MDITMHTIAHIRTDLPEKFGVPRQSGLVPQLQGTIVFEPDYRNPDALRGLEGFSHLWLIFRFHRAEREGWSPTVRPPRLGGNRKPRPLLRLQTRQQRLVALHLQGLRLQGVGKAPGGIPWAVGIGQVRLNVQNRRSVHQIRPADTDNRPQLLVPAHSLQLHAGQAQVVGPEG